MMLVTLVISTALLQAPALPLTASPTRPLGTLREQAALELVGHAGWELLRGVIEDRTPQTIAVDISHANAFSDGLSAGEWEQLQAALPADSRARIMRAERLPLEYQEIRVPGMLAVYRRLMEAVLGVIDTPFSSRVITPGRTTTDDAAWRMRQRV